MVSSARPRLILCRMKLSTTIKFFADSRNTHSGCDQSRLAGHKSRPQVSFRKPIKCRLPWLYGGVKTIQLLIESLKPLTSVLRAPLRPLSSCSSLFSSHVCQIYDRYSHRWRSPLTHHLHSGEAPQCEGLVRRSSGIPSSACSP